MIKDYIIKTYKAFWPQLEAMIEAEGGHIEGQDVLWIENYYSIVN